MTTKPLPRISPPLPLASVLIGSKIVLRIQAFSCEIAPKKCFGHYTSVSKWCLGCKCDKECRSKLVGAMNITVQLRPAGASLPLIAQKIEG